MKNRSKWIIICLVLINTILPIRMLVILGMLLPSLSFTAEIRPITWCDHALSLMREKRDSISGPLECQYNVWSLLGMFQDHNTTCPIGKIPDLPVKIPVNRARVLFIFPKARGVHLRAFDTPSSATAWRYHIVIDIEGTIVDLDMNHHDQLYEPGLYFKEMFEPKTAKLRSMWRSLGLLSPEDPLDAYVIKSLDAEDFVNEYGKVINGYIRTSSYYFNLAKEMEGVTARDYFHLRGIHEIKARETAEIDPALPGKVSFTPNEDADGLLDIEWKHEGTKCVLRMSDGEITLYRGRMKKWNDDHSRSWYEDKPVTDPQTVDLFVQKLYFEAKKNQRLRKVLDDGVEYRKAFD